MRPLVTTNPLAFLVRVTGVPVGVGHCAVDRIPESGAPIEPTPELEDVEPLLGPVDPPLELPAEVGPPDPTVPAPVEAALPVPVVEVPEPVPPAVECAPEPAPGEPLAVAGDADCVPHPETSAMAKMIAPPAQSSRTEECLFTAISSFGGLSGLFTYP
jgi:hypothetical protein